ncbi:MAG: oligosaccharide flippase family protein, partial [Bacilli bacterium]|nr:oligosaccharide flippase family protein [Bacilli bacterium]
MKNKFIKSTIILIIGGFITKILAMIIKIFLTRSIGDDGIGLYMLVLPTFNLFITLCTLSLSTSISKLISEKGNSKKIVLSIIPISLIYNFILMILLIILSPYIANNLLNNQDAYYPIISISFTLPFICLSNILKGYFYGKENMTPYVISNCLEQLVRLLLIIYIIPKLLVYGINIAVSSVVLINIISELSSIICLILFIPNKKINITYFKHDNLILKDILNISLSATGSRLIGSISYFLEPIILTFIMIKCGFDNNYIVSEYGVITGYVYPLLLLPSFFTMAISTSLLPVISNSYARGNYLYTKKKLKQALTISLFIGVFFTITFMLIPDILLKFIYNTNLGINYIKIIAPFFILHYIQGPLTSYLQAVDKSKEAMYGTLTGAIIKNILLLILPIFLGIWGFIIASLINILYVTIQHIYYVKKSF